MVREIEPIITVEDLDFFYGDFRALTNINLAIRPNWVTRPCVPSISP